MENSNVKERVEEYLKLFDDIKARVGDERSAMSILQEVSKDVRMDLIREERAGNGNGNDYRPATQRQLDYLEKLGVTAPEGLTKKRASELIDEALEKESVEDSSAAPAANIKQPWHSGAWD